MLFIEISTFLKLCKNKESLRGLTVKSRLFRHAVIVFFIIFEIATPTGIAEGRYYTRLRLSGTLVSAAYYYRGNIDSRRVDPSI